MRSETLRVKSRHSCSSMVTADALRKAEEQTIREVWPLRGTRGSGSTVLRPEKGERGRVSCCRTCENLGPGIVESAVGPESLEAGEVPPEISTQRCWCLAHSELSRFRGFPCLTVPRCSWQVSQTASVYSIGKWSDDGAALKGRPALSAETHFGQFLGSATCTGEVHCSL